MLLLSKDKVVSFFFFFYHNTLFGDRGDNIVLLNLV